MPEPRLPSRQILKLVRIGSLQRGRQPKDDACEYGDQESEKSTPALTLTSLSLGVSAGARLTMAFFKKKTVTRASTPEMSDKSVLSVNSWRARRARLAPIVRRIAISRRRPEERARRRLAMFTHAISSTNPTAPKRMNNSVRCGPTKSSLTGTSRTAHVEAAGYSMGYCRLSCDM